MHICKHKLLNTCQVTEVRSGQVKARSNTRYLMRCANRSATRLRLICDPIVHASRKLHAL